MDFELTDEQRLIVETVRAFVETELYPHEDEVERLDDVPPELVAAVQREGASPPACTPPTCRPRLGGGGLDAVGLTLVERELGRASYALQMLRRPAVATSCRPCDGEQRRALPAAHACAASGSTAWR